MAGGHILLHTVYKNRQTTEAPELPLELLKCPLALASAHPATEKDLRVVEKLTHFWRSPIVEIGFARAIDTVPLDLASYGPSIRFSAGCRRHRCGLRNGLGVECDR